jgi:hypothetical protein
MRGARKARGDGTPEPTRPGRPGSPDPRTRRLAPPDFGTRRSAPPDLGARRSARSDPGAQWSARAGRLSRSAATLLAVAVLGVCCWRLGSFVTDPPGYTAHERLWLAWSYRHPDPEGLFGAIEARLRPAEPIVIVAPLGRFESYWWRGTSSYFLWDHPIAAVLNRADPCPPAALGRTLVMMDDRGGWRVLRRTA